MGAKEEAVKLLSPGDLPQPCHHRSEHLGTWEEELNPQCSPLALCGMDRMGKSSLF